MKPFKSNKHKFIKPIKESVVSQDISINPVKKNIFLLKAKHIHMKKIKHKKLFYKGMNKIYSKQSQKRKVQRKDRLLRKWMRRYISKVLFLAFIKKHKIHRVYIYATNHNTILTVTRHNGDVLFRCSAGSVKSASFKKGARKKGFPSHAAGEEICKKLKRNKIKSIILFLKGAKRGKKATIRAFEKYKIVIHAMTDVTPIAHNGCRNKKRRRL